MAISESKKKIVIDNYFKKECNVNTSIKEAFAKGFELGLKKAPILQSKTGHWLMTGDYFTGAYEDIGYVECSCCHEDSLEEGDFCPNCGAKMIESKESEGKE